MNEEEMYTADVELTAENRLLGSVNYKMTVHTDGSRDQLFAQGSASTAQKRMNFTWYMDPDFMAVMPEGQENNGFYGITYKTFYDDIRSIPMLDYFISDDTLSQWNTSILNVQDQLIQDSWPIKIPRMSDEEMDMILWGVLALPCKSENRSLVVNGENWECRAISYQLTGAELGTISSSIPHFEYTEIIATFYICEMKLVKVQLNCISEAQNDIYELFLGKNPIDDILQLRGIRCFNDQHENFIISVDTENGLDEYTSLWSLMRSSEWDLEGSKAPVNQKLTAEYSYQPSSGKMTVFLNGRDKPVQFTLEETENKVRLETEDLLLLAQLITQGNISNTSTLIPCSMTISKGIPITIPNYKNLSEWSPEDFWELLSDVGVFIGLQVES